MSGFTASAFAFYQVLRVRLGCFGSMAFDIGGIGQFLFDGAGRFALSCIPLGHDLALLCSGIGQSGGLRTVKPLSIFRFVTFGPQIYKRVDSARPSAERLFLCINKC